MKAFSKALSTYLEKSSIHGLVYLTKKSSRTEKIFWICSLMILIPIFAVCVFQTTQNFLSEQTVIKVADVNYYAADFPFPAITHCLDSMVFESALEFTEKYAAGNFTDDDLADYQVIDLLYNQHFSEAINSSAPTSSIVPTLYKYLPASAEDVGGAFQFKFVKGVPFYVILTQWGVCLNFNLYPAEKMFHLDRVSPDFHYELPKWFESFQREYKLPDLPWSFDNDGQQFWVVHDPVTHRSFENMLQPLQSHQIIIHNSDEWPFRSGQQFRFGEGSGIFMYYNLRMNEIDEALESWPPERRNCFLPNERPLQFFKMYSKSNCEQECLSEQILKSCGCVPFYLVRGPETRVCGVADRKCFSRIEDNLDFRQNCNCFAHCSQLSYDHFLKTEPYTSKTQYGVILDSSVFQPIVRYRVVGALSLLAACGGLMGLVAGVSVFSIMELALTAFQCIKIICCRSKILPQIGEVGVRERKEFLASPSSFKRQIQIFFIDFLRESGIHGVHYVNDKQSTLTEKFFWSIAFLVSTLICFYAIITTVENLRSNVVGIRIEDKIWRSEDIPFPVVSFCPDLNAVLLHKYAECFVDRICEGTTWDEVMKKLSTVHAVSAVCWPDLKEYLDDYYSQQILIGYQNNITFVDRLGYFLDPSWTETNSFCSSQFGDGRTEPWASLAGLCFILNPGDGILNQESAAWHMHWKYVTKCKHDSGIRNGVFIELKMLKPGLAGINTTFDCLSPIGGIYIQNKNNDFMSPAAWLYHGTSHSISLKPKIITTDESLKDFTPEERNCYFEDEKKLKYYKKYSKNSCIKECTTFEMYETCGCVYIEYPHEAHHRGCLQRELNDCINDVLIAMSNQTSDLYKKCGCLSDCDSVKYTYINSRSQLSRKHSQPMKNVNGTFSLEADVSIFFDDDEYVAYKRYASYGIVSLLSDIGGYLGLFLGISLLSVIETIYLFTLRFINSIRLKRRSD